MNWYQNDYFLKNIIDKPEDQVKDALEEARQLSLSWLYWLQVEAPRPDGGVGYPGLFPATEVMGTDDGLAKFPYIRESRRIVPLFLVTENHIGSLAREGRPAEKFYDSVGVGQYYMDLHPSTGGDTAIHLSTMPFQIPMGALIPQKISNFLAGAKNIGSTHLTNGAYRMHPVEWNIGESAGLLASYCREKKASPKSVRESKDMVVEFQDLCTSQGIELRWPELQPETRMNTFDTRVLKTHSDTFKDVSML